MCDHAKTSYGEALPFSGPLTSPKDNPAAHGCCRYVETCAECEAEREVLVNGLHEEHGYWGPSRAERMAAADREVVEALRAAKTVDPVTIRRGDEWLRAEIDLRTGEIVLSHSPMTPAQVSAAASQLPTELLETAKRLRAAMIAGRH